MTTASANRLPVLMYHQVSEDRADGLTVTTTELEKHLTWLSAKGYASVTFQELHESMETGKPLPPKPVIITFDDAYASYEKLALPILQQAGFRSSLFVPVAYMGKTNIWDNGSDPILSADQINRLQNNGFTEVGIHSFLHRNYAGMAIEDMREDLENCFQTLTHYKVRFSRVLAYPYGGFPKRDPELKEEMKSLFAGMDLWFALRIGNRVNRLPLKERYEIKRIDIRGTDAFRHFRTKLRFGRTNPFA